MGDAMDVVDYLLEIPEISAFVKRNADNPSISDAINNTLQSVNVSDSNGEAANVVDAIAFIDSSLRSKIAPALNSLSHSHHSLALSLSPHGDEPNVLTALQYIGAGFHAIANAIEGVGTTEKVGEALDGIAGLPDAIQDLASAIRDHNAG